MALKGYGHQVIPHFSSTILFFIQSTLQIYKTVFWCLKLDKFINLQSEARHVAFRLE